MLNRVKDILTLLLLAAILVLGFQAWNSVGGFVGGIRQEFEDFGESVAALPQTVAESVMEALGIEKRASVELSDLSGALVSTCGASGYGQQSG